jgi:anaerobic selenocysteine-containing dehydrogenase
VALAREYPLELISAKNDDSMNSTFGHRPAVDTQTSILSIHPLDAAPRGIVQGMPVEVFNGRGACCGHEACVGTSRHPRVWE